MGRTALEVLSHQGFVLHEATFLVINSECLERVSDNQGLHQRPKSAFAP